MAQRPTLDLIVIGADAAGYAAAAAAMKLGARAALVRAGSEPKAAGLRPSPPNFVWRLLDLHRYDLATVDAGLTVTHLAEGEDIATPADPLKAARLLAARDPALEYLWTDFASAMARSQEDAETANAQPRGAAPFGLALADARWASAVDVLDDRFTDEGLKAHVLMSALAPLGLAGDEPGSALALFDAGARDPAQRVDAEALQEALAAAAKEAGVTVETGKLVRLQRTGDRAVTAQLDNGTELRAARAVASSALIADAAGLVVEAGGSPLRRQAGIEATIRLRYARKPRVKAGAQSGVVHHIVADKRALQRARDAMLEGRLDEAMPISFEIRGREIIARATYAPAAIRDNGAMREWTGQDLQILGRAAAATIGRRLDPACGSPQAVDTILGADPAAGLRRRDFSQCPVAAPAPSIDGVGAATALAMRLARA